MNEEEWYRGSIVILTFRLFCLTGSKKRLVFLLACCARYRRKSMKAQKVGKMAIFSVGAVLFSAHAGGGFATGNQANTYYVGLGWTGIVSAIIAMLLLILTMREAMVMYNQRNLTSAKELFENLYHPFDKLEILFEIFFNIMVLMAVAAAISGAASALQQYFGFNYYACVVAVGIVVLCLTIFGASVVRMASTYMGMAILVTVIVIYGMGIMKGQNIGAILANDFTVNGFMNMPKAILNAFTYAGFQCVTLPTIVACGAILPDRNSCSKAMWISFVMNAVALVLSVLMLISWKGVYGETTLPTLTSLNAMNANWMVVVYGICLLLCLISTAVTTTFGFVARFENIRVLKNVENPVKKRIIVSAFIIVVSMTISMAGLTNIIKYGYGYCGYLAIAIIIVPFLTVGVYKNYHTENVEVKEGVEVYENN